MGQREFLMIPRRLGLRFGEFMDEGLAAEVIWRGYFIDSKSWLVEAIENWLRLIESDPIRSSDPRLQVYAKVAVITFTVQAIEDFACMGYAYLRALEEGPVRIYEYVRDFAKPELLRSKANVGTVNGFFDMILNDDASLRSIIGFETNSQEFRETKSHLKSVREFHSKYSRLYLKFKHGQAFVILGTNVPMVYLIPDSIERQNGQVKFPSEPYLVTVDEWELAANLILRINGYFANLKAQSRKLFPAWEEEARRFYDDMQKMTTEEREKFLLGKRAET
jgi:hypothetical protein